MARYGLVIGIARYDNFRNLPMAVIDAEKVAQVLRNHGRFDVKPLPAEFTGSEIYWCVARDKKLTGKELGATLRTFLLEKAKNHEALIYFAGHGFEAPTLTGKRKGYLATSDCSSDGQNAISFDDFNDLIRESELSSLVVLLDCCYAGSLLENSFIRSNFPVFNLKQDYCLITASRKFETALEDIEGGIFTQAILRGLSEDRADEATGEVSASGLFDFISRRLKQSGQEPIYMGGGKAIPLVWYPPKNQVVAKIVREECPYRGLEAFDKQHTQFFFGRQKVVEDILKKLEQAQFVPIIGASGSGKSSVVRAGLISQLENNGWRVLDPIKPGIEPLTKLRGAFEPFFQSRGEIQQLHDLIHNHPGGIHSIIEHLPAKERFLLVIDQFEEVFTLCSKEDERRRFIELLTYSPVQEEETSVRGLPESRKLSFRLEGYERLAIVTTMRADFLEPFLSYPLLTQLIQNQAVYMPPLVGAQLEQAITSPANLQGYRFEDGLLTEIILDVGKEQGCLPLLQFALTELWEKRDKQKHKLTRLAYRDMGGVMGALDRHAEAIYQSFTLAQQQWVKRIFLKLVRTGDGLKDTRQRQSKTKLSALDSKNPMSDVLHKLIRGRLLVSGEEGVDLAHEALMEDWQTFAQWRKQGRSLRRLIDRMEDARREWHKQPKDENLMMGGLLAQVRENWRELESDLDAAAKQFYQRSDAHEKEQIAILNRALAESKLREKAARVLNLVPVKPLEALVLAIQSMGENLDKMPHQILTPVQNNLHSVMETVRVSIPLLRLMTSVSSVAISPNGQMIVSGNGDGTVCLWDVQGNHYRQSLEGHSASVYSVAISPDGQRVISGSGDGTLRLWDIEGNPIGQPFLGHKDIVFSVTFLSNGQIIASGSRDGILQLWDIEGNLIGQLLLGHENVIFSVAISPDGQMIASGSGDGTVQLWDIEGNLIAQSLQKHEASVRSVIFSTDGQRIVSGSRDKTVRLWDIQGNPIGQPLRGHKDAILSVAISPDGQRIISGSLDKTVRLWDIQGNPIGQPLYGHEDGIFSVALSPDGQRIVSGSLDGTVRLWECTGNSLEKTLQGHSAAVLSVATSPDGQKIVSSSEDQTVRLWDIKGNSIASPRTEYKGFVGSVAFSRDGQKIISGGNDGKVLLWDTEGDRITHIIQGHDDAILSVAVNSDGTKIFSGSRNGTVRLWDIQGNLIAQPLHTNEDDVTAIAWSPDGQKIVSGSRDGTLQLWDIHGNRICQTLQKHEGYVTAIAWSPDGQKIVSGSVDQTIRLWDRSGNPISQPFWGHEDYVLSVAFSPDGQQIVSGSDDKTVRLWDLAGNPVGQPFLGHEDSVLSVAFSPDGQTIVSGSDDGTVRLWRGGWQAWLQVCCNRLRHHPVFTNPQTEEEKTACETCRKWVWHRDGGIQN